MKKVTTDIFINNSIKKHGVKYNYDLVCYIKATLPVKIICPIHGEFQQTPNSHLNGNGCPKCGIIKSADKKRKSKEIFIKKAVQIHKNKYDYSLINYIRDRVKVIIVCPKHGQFSQRPDHHLHGHGCIKCAGIQKLTTEEFIEKSNKLHGNKYYYSNVLYVSGKKPVNIICPKHGTFHQRPRDHLKGNGCPHCLESKGEKEINNYLLENNIIFIRQKSFNNCKNINNLLFDFYLPAYNLCIEYDGIQHFKPLKFFGGKTSLKNTKRRDKIKTIYCQKNKINLIRIRYNEKVKEKLNNLFCFILKNHE